MRRTRLRVSIVIPAYNEERHLRDCLEAVEAQTVAPFEVIVVDNNSSDATVAIARSYPFVTVVPERRQGLVYARDAGFNATRGDIIGRIDADTILSPTWVADVQEIFQDAELDAVSGAQSFTDAPFTPLFRRLDGFFRRYLARSLAARGELFLYGGNMALRQEAWQKVRATICHVRRFHEDMDLAAHFAHTDVQIGYDERLQVSVSVRRIDSPIKEYYPYVLANSRTYAAHGLKGRFYMYPVELLVMFFYLPLRLLYRSYDPERRSFSLRRMLLTDDARRASPVSEVI